MSPELPTQKKLTARLKLEVEYGVDADEAIAAAKELVEKANEVGARALGLVATLSMDDLLGIAKHGYIEVDIRDDTKLVVEIAGNRAEVLVVGVAENEDVMERIERDGEASD